MQTLVTKPPKVLLVEDDRELLDMACRWLARRGFHTTPVTHPRHAMEAAALRDYDVAVVDTSLPEMDGVKLMIRLKRYVRDLQVILLSDHDDDGLVAEAFESGALAYLAKPCRLSELVRIIEQGVDRRRQRLEETAELACHS